MRIKIDYSALRRRVSLLVSGAAVVGIATVGALPAGAQAQQAPGRALALPDLVISFVHTDLGVVTIKNVGTAPAAGSWAQFGGVGAVNGWHWVPDLGPGWEHTFQDSRISLNCGWVAADDWQNLVVESNENNNFSRTNVCVR